MAYMAARPGEQFFYLTPKLQEAMYGLGPRLFVKWKAGGKAPKGAVSKLGRAALLLLMAQGEPAQRAALDAAGKLEHLDVDACLNWLKQELSRPRIPDQSAEARADYDQGHRPVHAPNPRAAGRTGRGDRPQKKKGA